MIRFNCDYQEGAHPRIMQALMETNMEQTIGYGEDAYCEAARKIIKEVCNCPQAAVHFLVGGTQANLTVISSILRPHQAVLCAKEGHINVHETGAIEACGHKVMALEGRDGKVSGDLIREAYKLHWEDGAHEHITQPKLVYISNPTELGTIYSKAELEDIRRACDECHMYLFLDGARLGYGLMSKENDLTMEDIAKNCDVFYIGGTKVGALFGEAVVITNPALQEDFRYIIKQKGGMLAKGRLLGIQFLELFKDGLYFEISEHAMKMAELLKDGLLKLGYEFYADSPTNQQFVIVSNKKLKELEENFSYEPMQAYGEDKRVVRFCTSWATKEEDVRALLEAMNRFEFRDILPEEADQAATIEQICFPPHEACSEAMMKERVAKVSELFLVAVDKETGKIAGFLNGLATDEKGFRDEFFKDSGLHNPTGSYVMLCGLDVLPQYRGQGLATEIMQQYIQRETQRGRKQLILTCLEEKISMYEKMGYRNNGIANSTWGNEEWYEMIYELN